MQLNPYGEQWPACGRAAMIMKVNEDKLMLTCWSFWIVDIVAVWKYSKGHLYCLWCFVVIWSIHSLYTCWLLLCLTWSGHPVMCLWSCSPTRVYRRKYSVWFLGIQFDTVIYGLNMCTRLSASACACHQNLTPAKYTKLATLVLNTSCYDKPRCLPFLSFTDAGRHTVLSLDTTRLAISSLSANLS